MAWPCVSAGAHAPHSDETHDPTPTRGASHSARRLRSLAFLGSSIVEILTPGFWKMHPVSGSLMIAMDFLKSRLLCIVGSSDDIVAVPPATDGFLVDT